ncbi:hypothetical protein KFF05_02360 [bacterium SCSIO 12827]|nr:hypothetical protein KFF05_02360 [bacterium SCSIO 12827]
MTAEVAVLNRAAVAIAADSAATVRGKVFNSANKIFALSRHQPVGIMIYGNAGFMGVPWETIIKLYRKKLGRKSFPTINEYTEDFFNFLCTEDKLFDEEYISNFTELFLTEIAKNKFNEIKEKSSIPRFSKTRLIQNVGRYIDQRCEDLSGTEFIRGFDKNKHDEYKRSIKPIIDKVINKEFHGCISSDRRLNKLVDILVSYLTKKWSDTGETGIVITGFGSEEIFPNLYCYECTGLFGGVVWRRQKYEVNIDSNDVSATLIAFAQTDVAKTFIDGIDPEIAEVFHGIMARSFKEVKKIARNKKVSALTDELMKNFYEEFEKFRFAKHVRPMLQMIDVLPIDELARLSEALVNITSLKRHVTVDLETVGGPIDVAVISKGDGLIWVSRKHYFNPETNPDYFARIRSD